MSRQTKNPRPRDHTNAARDVARDLSQVALELASIKGEAMNWLSDPNYGALMLENAHASVEAALVEARRWVRINEEDARRSKCPKRGRLRVVTSTMILVELGSASRYSRAQGFFRSVLVASDAGFV